MHWEEAKRCLCELLSVCPDDPRGHIGLGSIASQQGNTAKALSHYSIVDRLKSPPEFLLFAVAGILGSIGNYEGAIPYLERAAQSAESAAEPLGLSEQQHLGLLEIALVLLYRGHVAGIDAVARIFSTRAPHLENAIRKGLKAVDAHEPPILNVLRRLYEAAPNHDHLCTLFAGWLVSFGRDLEAKELLLQTVREYPTHWRALGMLGDLAHANGSFGEASKFVAEAARICPLPDISYPLLVGSLIRIASFDEASRAIDEGATKVKKAESILLLRVTLLKALGESTKALITAQDLARQYPESLDVQLALAESLTARGCTDDALKVQQQIANLYADDYRLARQWAGWYASQYKFSEAIEVLERVLALRPGDTDVMAQLMLMKFIDGDVAGAVAIDQTIDDLLETRGKEMRRFNHRHSFHRGLLREFNTNTWAMITTRQARTLPATLQVPRFLRELEKEPTYIGYAAVLLVRLRQACAKLATCKRETAAISKQVSQYWDSADPPDDVISLMSSWQHDQYEYQRYNDQSAWDFIKKHFDDRVLRAFEIAAHPTLRADLLRLAVLSVVGGIWGDADDRCCGSLEMITEPGFDLILLQEDIGTIGNNFIAAAPQHPFIQYALSVVTNNILERDGDSIWFISGPGALTLAFCHFYRNQLRQLSIPEGVRLIDTYTFSRTVAQHLPLAYKHQGSHWNHTSQRQRSLFRKPMGRPQFNTGEPNPFSKGFVGAAQERLDS